MIGTVRELNKERQTRLGGLDGTIPVGRKGSR